MKRKRKGMLSSERVVESVGVSFGDVVYRLEYGASASVARRVKVVRGIALSADPLPLETWIAELVAELGAVAQQTEAGRIALQGLLEGER